MKVVDPNEELSKRTLFVRGIPPSCSNEDLSEVFSQAGAVKECFIVKKKSAEKSEESVRPCIGYVTYMSADDVKAALRKNLSIDGLRLNVSIARKKKFAKKEVKGDTFEIVKRGDNTKEQGGSSKDKPKTENRSKSAENDQEYRDTFTVLVSGLPGLYKKDHALNLWKKSGLKEPLDIIIPCDTEEAEKEEIEEGKEGKGTLQNAKFVVDTKQAALKACNKLAGRIIGKKRNYKLKATLLTPEGDFKAARKSRLIVRNVSFQCSEEELKKAFDLYGTITEVKIPTKPNGQKRGFAFVQFSHVFEAARAIQAMNMQPIKGRKVAIDWSLPKEKYSEMKVGDTSGNMEQTDEEKKQEDGEQTSSKKHEEDSSEASDETSDDSGLEDGESEDEEESESNKETTDEEESEEESEGSESEEENIYEEPLKKASLAAKKKKLDSKSSHDVHEGKTVFIMNISYDANEEQLSEVLAEYGKLNYTKIVINHDTGMSKGCGFAQFSTLEEAENCVSALGDEDSGVMLDGRQIKVVKAVSRGDAETMKKETKKKKEKEDKRNLYLGREGLVRPGTQAAEGLSEIELKKREKIENAKRAKLKNPNIFVSRTRLCVHNLPKSVDEAKLREILLGQFKDRKGIRITECRIMRDMKNLNEKGIGRSLGYAFVDFSKHENALKALRSANNNPEIFGPVKRPIVEFALENKKALQIKEQRKKRFVAKMKLKEKIQDPSSQENVPVKAKKIGRRERQKRKADTQKEVKSDVKRQKLDEKGGKGRKGRVVKYEKGEDSGKKANLKGKNKQRKRTGKRDDSEDSNQKKQNERVEIGQEERKSFQGSTGTTLSGKKLPLPTHAGPKIRQKNRGKIMEQMRKSKKLNSRTARQKLVQKFNEKRASANDTKAEKREVRSEGKRNSVKNEKAGHNPSRRRKRGEEDADFNALVAKYTKAILAKTPNKAAAKWFEE